MYLRSTKKHYLHKGCSPFSRSYNGNRMGGGDEPHVWLCSKCSLFQARLQYLVSCWPKNFQLSRQKFCMDHHHSGGQKDVAMATALPEGLHVFNSMSHDDSFVNVYTVVHGKINQRQFSEAQWKCRKRLGFQWGMWKEHSILSQLVGWGQGRPATMLVVQYSKYVRLHFWGPVANFDFGPYWPWFTLSFTPTIFTACRAISTMHCHNNIIVIFQFF